jgi:D-alanine-D-alanine ligase
MFTEPGRGKAKIGVLAGGFSAERDISLKSGRAVLDALLSRGLDAFLVDIEGELQKAPDWLKDIDVAFIALHGSYGEDGRIQDYLDQRRVAYTGSGPRASARAMDKIDSKTSFKRAGLKVPSYVLLKSGVNVRAEGLVLPCVIKPASEGSSIGLTVVHDKGQIKGAVREALESGGPVIAEEYIYGRELTVGVLGEEALPVVEIISESGVYDYRAKYESSGTFYSAPADLVPELDSKCREAALIAHRSLGCRGFSRTDMRLTPDGQVYVLEVNTIPGLTRRSLLPMSAGAAGIDFGELCIRMIYESLPPGERFDILRRYYQAMSKKT